MLIFAANLTMMFTEWAFLDRFAAAADAGFTAIEFQFPYAFEPDDIAARLETTGLALALFNLPPGDMAAGDRGLAALPERRVEFRASVALAQRYADALGATRLHVMSGRARSNDPRARAAYADALRYAVETLDGIEVLIEPLNGTDNPGYFLDSFEAAAALIDELKLPTLKLQFDVYHRQRMRGDVLAGLEALLPIIGHVQIASVPERAEPGSGELDDTRIFERLDSLGYRGFVGCEYNPARGTRAGLDGWDAIRKRDSRAG